MSNNNSFNTADMPQSRKKHTQRPKYNLRERDLREVEIRDGLTRNN